MSQLKKAMIIEQNSEHIQLRRFQGCAIFQDQIVLIGHVNNDRPWQGNKTNL